MTPAKKSTDPTGNDSLPAELDTLLAQLTRQASARDQERLRRALRTEVERREYAAYARGWQDAMGAPAGLTS